MNHKTFNDQHQGRDAAPELPADLREAAAGARPASEGDDAMRSSPGAQRLVLEEPESTAARPRETDQDDDNDFSIRRIAAEAAALEGNPIHELANLFHGARIGTNFVRAKADNLSREAHSLRPEVPPEIRHPRAPNDPTQFEYPTEQWPSWRRAIYTRWDRQCDLIRQALGVPDADGDLEDAEELCGSLAQRVLEAPARTLQDARDKLGVLIWELATELGDLQAPSIQALWRIHKDLEAMGTAERDTRDA